MRRGQLCRRTISSRSFPTRRGGAGRAGARSGRATQGRIRSAAHIDRDRHLPKLDLVNLESQFKAAEAVLCDGRSRARSQHRARALGGRHHGCAGRSRRRGFFHGRQGDRADRRARSDAGGGGGRPSAISAASRSAHPPKCASSPGKKCPGGCAMSRNPPAPRRAPIGSRWMVPNADGAIPDGITAEVAVAHGAGAGHARAALRAHLLLRRRPRRPRRGQHRRRAIRAGHR